MIDFISATKHLSDKDKPFWGHCQLEATYSSGWQKYSLQGLERIEIWHHPDNGMLRLQGSIMYYYQGHNFTYNKAGFVEAITYIQRLLHISLWDAMVAAFEFGEIMEVPSKPKEYIQHHTAAPREKLTANEKAKDKGNFRWWNDGNVSLKMYDAGKNIQLKQGMDRKQAIAEAGWKPEGDFLKWEAHYLKPEIMNHGKGLLLADLVNPNWENVFREDLYLQYKRLIPMKSIILPDNKKDLSTADIIALALAEESLNNGTTIAEVKKMLYSKVNVIPEEILSESDKKARKRQIKILLDKIKESPESKWDLSEKLEAAMRV